MIRLQVSLSYLDDLESYYSMSILVASSIVYRTIFTIAFQNKIFQSNISIKISCYPVAVLVYRQWVGFTWRLEQMAFRAKCKALSATCVIYTIIPSQVKKLQNLHICCEPT